MRKQTRRIAHLTVVVLGCALVGGCGDDGDDSPAQLPNPASVYCEGQGGEVRIDTAADGSQSGTCVLPDGTEVDEWEYYRTNHPINSPTT